jgi:TolB-like protein
MAHDVFISHSTKDKTVADAVCAMLEEHKIRCWIAPRDITPGKEWGEAIVDAIGTSRVMILIFSASANGSPQIRREVERAVNKEVVVVPLRIEDVVPTKSLEYFIGSVHWLDALTPPLEKHLDKLVRVVEGVLGSIVEKPANSGTQVLDSQAPSAIVPEQATSSGVAVDAHESRIEMAPKTRARKSIWLFVALGALGVAVVVFAAIYFSRTPSAGTHDVPSSSISKAPAAIRDPVGARSAPNRANSRSASPTRPAGAGALPSVAVITFKNVSGRPDKAWLSVALSRMLTTELAAGGQLRTVPGEDVAKMKFDLSLPDADSYGRDTLQKIHKKLYADKVVVGSYIPLAEGQIRLDLRLQDAVQGETLAAISEKGSEDHMDDLVIRAGGELRAKLGVGDLAEALPAGAEPSRLPPWNPEAVRVDVDTIVLRRAKLLLAPPAGVTLSVERGTLRVEGVASPQWIARLKDRAPWIAGVADLDTTRLQNQAIVDRNSRKP